MFPGLPSATSAAAPAPTASSRTTPIPCLERDAERSNASGSGLAAGSAMAAGVYRTGISASLPLPRGRELPSARPALRDHDVEVGLSRHRVHGQEVPREIG